MASCSNYYCKYQITLFCRFVSLALRSHPPPMLALCISKLAPPKLGNIQSFFLKLAAVPYPKLKIMRTRSSVNNMDSHGSREAMEKPPKIAMIHLSTRPSLTFWLDLYLLPYYYPLEKLYYNTTYSVYIIILSLLPGNLLASNGLSLAYKQKEKSTN